MSFQDLEAGNAAGCRGGAVAAGRARGAGRGRRRPWRRGVPDQHGGVDVPAAGQHARHAQGHPRPPREDVRLPPRHTLYLPHVCLVLV